MLSLKIAKRYLFAKRSTNAINIISGVSVLGITIGTAALILVLSVFNGFEDLLTSLFNTMNPDVKIIPVKGKTFIPDDTLMFSLRKVDGVKYVAETIEEIAFFEYRDKRYFANLKGVDSSFTRVTEIDSVLSEGVISFRNGEIEQSVIGLGLRNKLGISLTDEFTPMTVYMPKRTRSVAAFDQPFRKMYSYPVGTFYNQQDFDNQYVLTSIEFARSIMGVGQEVSSIEIALDPALNTERTISNIRSLFGDEFTVKNRYQQDEAFLKLMNMEKWMSFAILSLMLILIAFNMVGALWMIVLEKRNDISILKSMGATDQMIRWIFLGEGILLTGLGIAMGFVLALLLYFIQINYGIISFPGGFAFESYPISLRLQDFIIVLITVLFIGFLASILPANRAMKVPSIIRED